MEFLIISFLTILSSFLHDLATLFCSCETFFYLILQINGWLSKAASVDSGPEINASARLTLLRCLSFLIIS